MEHLPIEVVGDILSRIAAARDVVRASITCRKWREAFRNHLRVLSFDSNDWDGFHSLDVAKIEILITRIIFQTRGLQSLSILLSDLGKFSAAVVMSWLLYMRESLQKLQCHVSMRQMFLNIVEFCSMPKLEILSLTHVVIEQKEFMYRSFTSVRSLSLTSVGILDQNLDLLLATSPKLEYLELIDVSYNSMEAKIEVKAPNLRRFYAEGTSMEELILESDSIQSLHLRDMRIEVLKVIGNGNLKMIKIEAFHFERWEISDSVVNLETVDISGYIPKPEFYWLISRSSNLRMLRLWDTGFARECVDMEKIAMCCPQLTHLFICCDLNDLIDGVHLPYCLGGSACFGNVVHLKVGWLSTLRDVFFDLVMGLFERCPKLKKVDIEGPIGSTEYHEDVRTRFKTAIDQITWNDYIDVQCSC